VKGQGE